MASEELGKDRMKKIVYANHFGYAYHGEIKLPNGKLMHLYKGDK